ncbi:exosortase C-terminal domain/associated protein EpsI [Desulfogranum mediterraneum]|uniref:exosortase C-terminal domain/associated protein EpsI n=1 Tax=Desulfogranum mediterraneum TaxID=160661 RepID=UPI000491F442|nr:exosortase C-terminal domain/associated protein EpsI [Desulfogranum mediterraneum]
MENLKLRYLIVVLLMALTVAVVQGVQYVPSQDMSGGLSDLEAIPMSIDDEWYGRDFPLEEQVYDILETRSIIHRSYSRPDGERIFLSIVHYSDTKVDFHTPEACLGGRGLKTEKTEKTISFPAGGRQVVLGVAEIMTRMEAGGTLTYYFYKSGDFIGSSYIFMRLSIAANKLFRNDTRGSLIRVSTSITPAGGKAEAELLLRGFLRDFYPYVLGVL